MSAKLNMLFVVILFAVAAQYGVWTGHGVTDVRNQTSTNAAFLVVISLVEVAAYFLLRKSITPKFSQRLILGLFFLNLLVTTFARPDVESSLRQLVAIVLTSGIVAFLSALLHSVTLQSALKVTTVSLTIVLLVSTLVHLLTVGLLVPFDHGSFRLNGLYFFGEVGMLTGITALLSFIGLLVSSDRGRRVMYALNALLMLFLLACTDTRSAMIGFLLAASAAVVLERSRRRALFRFGVILGFLSILAVAGWYFFSSESGQSVGADIDYRSVIWASAVIGIATRPLTGFGQTNFFDDVNYAGQFGPVLDDAHSAMLGHALAYGIPSLVLFLIFFFRSGYSALTSKDQRVRVWSAIALYWFVAPLFWGVVYRLSGNFVQVVFGITLIGLVSHPEIRRHQAS
jgi:O-antigen ligase